ncbi:hypothetical protein [Bifidobacterium vansinderenii]|uniref:Macrolide ABC transporter ATP-binding protein n=1 Tax=Bifidobacterium vansinderenii TaxID=1984871 RepID=A0A229VXD4_9BIFI|nr:hypothetical protein [Bifidobacterium vansinderenii]OXN00281.1 macrolide ABC transporter ATP-binding protein [Bifidobacterium vansinderenii]
MKDLAFRPSRPRAVSEAPLDNVFAADTAPVRSGSSATGDDGWTKTSVAMRRSTRRRVKLWALEHDMSMQEVVDLALEEYLASRP